MYWQPSFNGMHLACMQHLRRISLLEGKWNMFSLTLFLAKSLPRFFVFGYFPLPLQSMEAGFLFGWLKVFLVSISDDSECWRCIVGALLFFFS